MKRLSLCCTAAMAAAMLSPAHAATTEEAVIVTATRTARTADETLASVSVITRADIERTQAKSVAELLAGEAGIDTTVSGGYGKSTSVFLRGTNSDHTLVLIDGIKVGSATLGTAPWQYLPLDQIERIEIVRGPRSSLYGSEAIGGVIQIFTRQPTKNSRAWPRPVTVPTARANSRPVFPAPTGTRATTLPPGTSTPTVLTLKHRPRATKATAMATATNRIARA